MRKALVALALVAVAMLVLSGCSQKITPIVTGGGDEQAAANQEAAEEQTITGRLSQVESLESELTDPELDNTAEYIEEINW
ncbi:hypothetical protein JXB28_06430 [Candidatus Woesearchaeota archaeon]|nr:hypothetical protein [Candidatus Woesearchaeota archaeon]